ncbi:MAG: SpoIIE family protein phosphatase [Roseburia sp.]|nr:SpoIIE family protein phosphatase [Roseburia sp.]MCM1242231.1 SpoIIE family protein phosphatase [Roseburia sp.]
MEKPRYSICRKITALLLFMVLVALILTGGVSFFSLYSMKNISEKSNTELGAMAAFDAEEALEEMAGEQLLGLATEKAAYIEEKFNSVLSCVDGIAQAAEDIYRHPERYPDRDVPLPEKDSRALAPQLMWSHRLALCTQEEMEELYKLGNLQDMLVQYNRNNKMISSTYLATESGWMLQADYIAYSKYSGDSDVPDFFEAHERAWYQKASAAQMGECVYTDVMQDFHEGKDCIICSKAVYLNGEIVAVAGVGSYLDTVHEAVLETVIGDNGYAFLVNHKGQIIVSGAETGETAVGGSNCLDLRESTNKELAWAVEDMLDGQSGLAQITLDGRGVYLAYAPLKGLNWSFVTVMDVAEVVEPARQSQQLILSLAQDVSAQQEEAIRRMFFWFVLIVLFTAVLISAGSVLFAGRLTKPISRLTEEVARMGEGNLDREIHIASKDEVEKLSDAFNNMRKQLKTYIQNLATATAEKERICTELDLASRIQADMLPDPASAFADRKEFILYACMTPAKNVGGDFYDFFLIDDDHLAFLIADVSGKGIPAALFMVVAKTLLQSRIAEGVELDKAVTEVNERLCAENENGMFVTAWIGVLTLSTGVLTYVNAGHNPPLLGNRNNEYVYLREKCGFVLAGMEDITYIRKEMKLMPGDTLFLYTDGVSETNDENGNLFGEERLQKLLNRQESTLPGALTEAVWKSIQSFQGTAEQFDDVTMLVLHYFGGVTALSEPEEEEREIKKDEISVPAELFHIDEVQRFLETTFASDGVSPKNVRQMLIASDEIFSNICRYSDAKKVVIKCSISDEEAVLVLEDDGRAFNPLEQEKVNISAALEERKEGGLGIHMVREIMDKVEYQYDETRKRNCLILKKKK